MNLKIAKNNLSFKITKKELLELADNKNLNSFLQIANQKIKFTIGVVKQNQISNIYQSIDLEIKIKNNFAFIKLLVSEQTIKTLIAMGRNKQGITVNKENLIINLQVDTRYYL